MAEKKEEKKKRKHLHQIRSEQAEDGSIVHHHTYGERNGHREPERMNVATSGSPEEAGEHAEDNFAQNNMEQAPEQDPSEQPDPAATAGAMPGQE